MERKENFFLNTEKILRNACKGSVTEDAIQHFMGVIDSYAVYLANYATEIARQSGRKNIDATDVKLASANVSIGAMRVPPPYGVRQD